VTPLPRVDSSSQKTIADAQVKPDLGPPVDLSKHTAALVHEAVWKPTVLATTYRVPENIGDRISRLTAPKPVESQLIQFKIPLPDPNGTSANVSPASEALIDPEHAAALVHEAVSKPTVLPTSYTIPENIGDRISRLTAPNPVESDIVPPEIPQPDAESTSAYRIEPQSIEAETKKSLDDTPLEASTAATVVAEAPPVEELQTDSSVGVVVEPLEVAEIPDDAQTSATVAIDSATVEETTERQEVAESVEVNETAEAEEPQAPTFLERVSSVIESVSTAFMNPDGDRKDAENVDNAQLVSSVNDTPGTDTVAQLTTEVGPEDTEQTPAPSFLERVSAVVETVATSFKQSAPDDKNTEATEEPTPAVEEKASDSQTLEVICPTCGATDIRKNGHRQGKQRYACKDCGRQFAMPESAETEDKPKSQTSSSVETAKNQDSQADDSVSEGTSKSSKGRNKKKTKAKGFGGSKA
jgi:predicted RNA-binding Zn-ribbon protein involved in translation (DUF1610 family)